MPPKAKANQAPNVNDLVKPIVTASELAEAHKMLENAAELDRQRSNMKYYLKSVGLEGKYAQMNSAAKKTFLESWFAQKLKETTAKLSSSSSKAVVNTTAVADNYFRASK